MESRFIPKEEIDLANVFLFRLNGKQQVLHVFCFFFCLLNASPINWLSIASGLFFVTSRHWRPVAFGDPAGPQLIPCPSNSTNSISQPLSDCTALPTACFQQQHQEKGASICLEPVIIRQALYCAPVDMITPPLHRKFKVIQMLI